MSFATPVSIPHWHFPVLIDPVNGVATDEQGSVQEVTSGVLMIVSCPVNTCNELPTFGIPDPTGQQAPPSPDAIVAAVQAIDPRADESAVVSMLNQDPSSWQMSFTTSVTGTSGQ